MAFKTSYNSGLGQLSFNLNAVDTTAKVAIGTIIKGFDDLLGEGEFIYLPGAASTIANDFVTYELNPAGPTTTRLLAASAANTGLPVANAVVAVPAGSYGWYQISGVTIANVIAATAAGRLFASATAGSGTSTAAAGAQVLGARISTAIGTPVAGTSYITMSRPTMQGQIT